MPGPTWSLSSWSSLSSRGRCQQVGNTADLGPCELAECSKMWTVPSEARVLSLPPAPRGPLTVTLQDNAWGIQVQAQGG